MLKPFLFFFATVATILYCDEPTASHGHRAESCIHGVDFTIIICNSHNTIKNVRKLLHMHINTVSTFNVMPSITTRVL